MYELTDIGKHSYILSYFFDPEVQKAWNMLIFTSDLLSVVIAEYTELIR